MRMAERRERLRFALESLFHFGIGRHMRWQNFDRDDAIKTAVGGLVDLAHSARPERSDDLERAEACARSQGHWPGLLIRWFGVSRLLRALPAGPSGRCGIRSLTRLIDTKIVRRPSVQAVLRHALFGECLHPVVVAGAEGTEQCVSPDLLMTAAVVDLVELVAPAELGADRIPQQLHQLYPIDRLDSA